MPKQTAIFRHALRNALLRTISIIALSVDWLRSGVVLIDSVFAYPVCTVELGVDSETPSCAWHDGCGRARSVWQSPIFIIHSI